MEYPWYTELPSGDETLEQGDFITDCPVVIPSVTNLEEGMEVTANVEIYNVVILTQSCDLENGKVENVLVCPYYWFEDFMKGLPEGDQKKKGREKKVRELKQGLQPAYHALNKDAEKGLSDNPVVDFRNVYGVHIDYLKEHVKAQEKRIRLNPPYKEHLSQAFARFFMRVGLPAGIEMV